jgi:hypothetical protein
MCRFLPNKSSLSEFFGEKLNAKDSFSSRILTMSVFRKEGQWPVIRTEEEYWRRVDNESRKLCILSVKGFRERLCLGLKEYFFLGKYSQNRFSSRDTNW